METLMYIIAFIVVAAIIVSDANEIMKD